MRSASFSIGALSGLHESGHLERTELMSAVSGGSYALSWLYLQQYYALVGREPDAESPRELRDAMFDPDGAYQAYLEKNFYLDASGGFGFYISKAFHLLINSIGFSPLNFLGNTEAEPLNRSSTRKNYAKAVEKVFHHCPDPERCGVDPDAGKGPIYIEPRDPEESRHYRGIEPVSFPELAAFSEEWDLPLFVVSATAQLPDDFADLRTTLDLVSFELGPFRLGSGAYGFTSWSEGLGSVGTFNLAPAISGAAFDAKAFGWGDLGGVATRSFDLDLGYWIPTLQPTDEDDWIYLTDGGHSENLGAFPLIRRGCHRIVIVDAAYDPELRFSDYRRLREYLATQHGIQFEVPGIEAATSDPSGARGTEWVFSGSIRFPRAADGGATAESEVVYVKLAMRADGDYPQTVTSFAASIEGLSFPQQPTADVNYSAAQFAAYRDLGHAVVTSETFREVFPPP